MTLQFTIDDRSKLIELRRETKARALRKRHMGPGGLLRFVEDFWWVVEPETRFVNGWPLEAICRHLEAVSNGEIQRLLINVPPGFMKSLLCDVFWPAWEWAVYKASYRYVAFSYSAQLTERDNNRFSALVSSVGEGDRLGYQDVYGGKVQLRKVGQQRVSNSRTGWKLASSVGGVSTGERGDRIILDDPHNVKEGESEVVRSETVRWFREAMSNRLNDMQTGAIVIIMQRVHEEDVSGAILEAGLDYVHLMIPMEYDRNRQATGEGDPVENAIGWYDPRYDEGDLDEVDGMLAWPDRFPDDVVERMKLDLGPYAWAGQYGQAPAPRGGGIFQRDWWQLWEAEDGKFPAFEFMLASLDSAFTENEMNDPSALTIWGVWQDKAGKNRLMLVHAWRKHLQFSGPRIEPEPNETKQHWRWRTQKHWGLIEWIRDTCERYKVDLLLIEAKASGISAAQELRSRYDDLGFAINLCPVKGDKVARALAVQATFAQQMVYAPDREWSEMVIAEMAVFPKGRYKDLTDSTTQAIKYLRDNGMAMTDSEQGDRDREMAMPKKKRKALYPV